MREVAGILILPFAGPAEGSASLLEQLSAVARDVLRAPGLVATLLNEGSQPAPAPADAERERRRFGAHVVVFGVISASGEIEAHAMFEPLSEMQHLDSYTHDWTTRRVRVRIPSSNRTRLWVETGEQLEQCIRALAAHELVVELLDTETEGAENILDYAVDQSAGLRGDALDEGRSLWLIKEGARESGEALSRLESFLPLAGPGLLRDAAAFLPGLRGADTDEVRQEALDLLRRAAQVSDDPLRGMSLYNLAASLGGPEYLSEAEGVLEELRQDPVYKDAWYAERLRGALEWGRSVTARREGDATAVRDASARAARHYARALRMRRKTRRVEDPAAAHALRRAPRSPVLHANAYDAHHFAGHAARAAWHHRRAQIAVSRLYNIGLRAMGTSDWPVAARAFELAASTDWDDEIGVRARVFAASALMQLGAEESAEAVWNEALQMDRHTALALRAELRAVRDTTGLVAGMPGDRPPKGSAD